MDITDQKPTLETELLIAAALPWEARTALQLLGSVHSETESTWPIARGTTQLRRPVHVLTTGMGTSRAGRALEGALARIRPAAILSIGCAGALGPELRPGDLVIATEIRVEGGPSVAVDADWRARLDRAAARSGLAAVAGPLLTSGQILAGAGDKRRAYETTAALAVEMEAAAIAAAARHAGIPFAAARAILDVADAEMTFARDLVGEDGRLRVRALLGALLRGRARAVRELRSLAIARRACALSLERLCASLFTDPWVANQKELG